MTHSHPSHRSILFVQGGGAGAHKADAQLVEYLRRHLGKAFALHYPAIANESEPEYERWQTAIAEELARLDGEVILVGHSLGASFLLKYLAETSALAPIAGLFLIATPFWGGQGWRFQGYERAQLPQDFGVKFTRPAAHREWRGIRTFLYHSRDDATVPFAHLALYAEQLPDAVVRTLDGRGHQLNNDLSEVVADIRTL